MEREVEVTLIVGAEVGPEAGAEAGVEAGVGVEVGAGAEVGAGVGAEVIPIIVIPEAGHTHTPLTRGVAQGHDHIQDPEVDHTLHTPQDHDQGLDHLQFLVEEDHQVFWINEELQVHGKDQSRITERLRARHHRTVAQTALGHRRDQGADLTAEDLTSDKNLLNL